jgi:CheY-like chemotaxis protein
MPSSHGERARILVVDDERGIAITLAAILESEGYCTLTAFNGHSAVEIASSFNPDTGHRRRAYSRPTAV